MLNQILNYSSDSILDSLIKRVEEMDKADKTGLSWVDIYKPYSDLYTYCIFKINLKKYEERNLQGTA